ncbi:MAG: hypothetical protein WEA58_07260 [Balneolaceae bacterium]
MSVVIHKKDSLKTIREVIEKASSHKKKKPVDIGRYFGKVKFGMDGLEYQKKLRYEWE